MSLHFWLVAAIHVQHALCTSDSGVFHRVIAPVQQQHSLRNIALKEEEDALQSCPNTTIDPDLAARYAWAVPAKRNADYCTIQKAYTEILEDARTKGRKLEVLFYGDSLVSSLRWDWPATQFASEVFAKFMHPYNVEPMGIGRDTLSSLMWRILAGNAPVGVGTKVAVLVQYANDMWQASYTDDNFEELLQVVAVRLISIADYLMQQAPGLQVVILGPLPPCAYIGEDQDWQHRYQHPNWMTSAVRSGQKYLERLVEEANEAADEGAGKIHLLDCWRYFLTGDQSMINPLLTRDGVHPTGAGWDVLLGECIVPKIQQLVGH